MRLGGLSGAWGHLGGLEDYCEAPGGGGGVMWAIREALEAPGGGPGRPWGGNGGPRGRHRDPFGGPKGLRGTLRKSSERSWGPGSPPKILRT